MCLIAWRWLPDSNFPLIWAANRDEFAHRSTGALQTWTNTVHPSNQPLTVLSGLDLELPAQNGVLGTWSGINDQGRFAWLTNIRGTQHANPAAPSRGHLVSRFLTQTLDPEVYLQTVQQQAKRYNGFNLVVGQIGAETGVQASCLHFNSVTGLISTLKPGVYGLSNADLDTPWAKTKQLVQALTLHAASVHHTFDPHALFKALSSEQRCASHELPNTGIPREIEHLLSSAFIHTQIRQSAYGTRSSTVGWMARLANHSVHATVREHSFGSNGINTLQTQQSLAIKVTSNGNDSPKL